MRNSYTEATIVNDLTRISPPPLQNSPNRSHSDGMGDTPLRVNLSAAPPTIAPFSAACRAASAEGNITNASPPNGCPLGGSATPVAVGNALRTIGPVGGSGHWPACTVRDNRLSLGCVVPWGLGSSAPAKTKTKNEPQLEASWGH